MNFEYETFLFLYLILNELDQIINQVTVNYYLSFTDYLIIL